MDSCGLITFISQEDEKHPAKELKLNFLQTGRKSGGSNTLKAK